MKHIAVLFETKKMLELTPVSVQESISFTETKIDFFCRLDKKKYIETVNKLLAHIKRGDIYEINYCIEFFAENVVINPKEVFFRLKLLTEAPFARLYKADDNWIICASPERFVQKRGNKLITEPMKGTARRSIDSEEDSRIREGLANSIKEQTENVMAVDVARNDLSILAKKGTVFTDVLFDVKTFKNIHQMVSTISCEVKPKMEFKQIIDATFPPASMTGAPKIKAVELIKKHEFSKRGIYSGCLGYIDENGDFDFCVVIRTIIYNERKKSISFHVGSAITASSNPEEEWNECMLKADSLLIALNTNINQVRFLK